MVDANQLRDVVRHAMDYPYANPGHSFVLPAERSTDMERIDIAGRIPLLAYGSNAAPEVLARKLGASVDTAPVPVIRATLSDFDVVYSAHISPYGAVPATLQRSPGTQVSTFVAHLTEEQLGLLAETEPNYEASTFERISCRLDGGALASEALAFLSRHGCLLFDGSEVALAAVKARGRRFQAMSEPQVLELVRRRLAPQHSIERFVADSASNPSLARRRTATLRGEAKPLTRPTVSDRGETP